MEACKSYHFNNVLSHYSPKQALSRLQNDFAIVPVDKAASNLAFICKEYYAEIVSREIEVTGTFEKLNISSNEILTNVKKNKYINTATDSDKIPSMYATIKMHKDPVDFRFITSGRDTVLQNLSSNVGKCLNKLISISKTYDQYKIKNIDNCIFIIDNRDAVVNFVSLENFEHVGRKEISTWDFSTLYTKIPHSQLKVNVEWFVRKVFSFLDKKFINASSKCRKAYLSVKRSLKNCSFNEEELIESVKFIIDNSYINFKDSIFRQIIGIPMGTNCAPHLADIYLHVFEYKYIIKLVTQGHLNIAKQLSQVFRFQDDCIAINDDGLFALHSNRIYPSEMILKKTNISINKVTFLDLTISIYRQKLIYYTWDKRRDFNFEVVTYPNLSGNIPSAQSYGVYTSQLIRFCDINMTLGHFIADIKRLTEKFLAQGFKRDVLRAKFISFRNKYFFKWAKYGNDISSCLSTLFGTPSCW